MNAQTALLLSLVSLTIFATGVRSQEAHDAIIKPPQVVADYVLTNGKIYTVDADQPWAQAIAISGNKIAFVGSSSDAVAYIGEKTNVADLSGRLLLPGLIDSHLHGLMGAAASSGVWVAGISNVDELLVAIRDYANENSDKDVIFGWGYGLELFGPEGPTKELLDKAVPDRPAYIVRGDGHSAWANTKALELAGVDRNTPDPAPPAGVFGRDADGNPTGAINGGPANIWMVENLPGAITSESIAAAATPMLNAISEEGITTIFDAGAPISTDAAFQTLVDLDDSGDLPQRYLASHYINAAHQANDAIARLKELDQKYRSENFSVIALKITTDGVVENRKAAVWDPYLDGSGNGSLNFAEKDVIRLSVDAAREGYDIYLHTLGDRAVSVGLDAADAVRDAGFTDVHYTLSHVQMIDENDYPRFKPADVFINSTGGWWVFAAEEQELAILGDRANNEYSYRNLIDEGVLLAMGSDFPADARINPWIHIDGAVNRRSYQLPKSSNIKNPSNRITVKEAIESYSINGAKLLHMEDKIGSLEVGKMADLIVVDQNVLEIPSDQIHKTRVLMTMMDGKVWHDVIFGWGDSTDDVIPDVKGILPHNHPRED